MKQSQRVRVFAVGFFAGCMLAAGIALLRSKDEPKPEEPLPAWSVLTTVPEIPVAEAKLPPGLDAFKAWRSDDGTLRWLARDGDESFWRISLSDAPVEVIRADRIRALGNPGIEIAALEAGLEHNNFEILEFDPVATAFTVPVAPFEPNAVEEARRLLESRQPFIQSTESIVFRPGGN